VENLNQMKFRLPLKFLEGTKIQNYLRNSIFTLLQNLHDRAKMARLPPTGVLFFSLGRMKPHCGSLLVLFFVYFCAFRVVNAQDYVTTIACNTNADCNEVIFFSLSLILGILFWHKHYMSFFHLIILLLLFKTSVLCVGYMPRQ
jgi:hypothetical protein